MPVDLEDEIRQFVLTTVSKDMNHPLDYAEVGEDSPLGSGGLDLDSLGLIELTIRLEQRFGVQFPETDIEPFGAMTLHDLVLDLLGRGAAV